MKSFMPRFARIALVAAFAALVAACSSGGGESGGDADDAVTIADKGDHYAVTLDFSTGLSHREIGRLYGKAILATVPNIESLIDSYIAETCYSMAGGDSSVAQNVYKAAVQTNVGNVKPQVPQDYRDEIDGMSVLCGAGAADVLDDGKLSVNELYAINLILDVSKGMSCSAFSAFGAASATGKTVTGRVLDWNCGSRYQLNKLHAVVTIKNGPKSIALVGFLGYMAGLSVVNDDGVFAAILESSAASLPTAGKNSYSMDLRAAMENCATMDAVAARLSTPAYVSGNLVFLSDATSSEVLENDLSTTRTVRKAGDALLPGVTWFDSGSALGTGSIATVNAFMREGKYDRFTGKDSNENRWATLRARADAAFGDGSIDAADVRDIMTAYAGSAPADMAAGDVYNTGTQQIMVFEPATMKLSVFFAQRNGWLPSTPTFSAIPLSF
jgi:hypothetical protein